MTDETSDIFNDSVPNKGDQEPATEIAQQEKGDIEAVVEKAPEPDPRPSKAEPPSAAQEEDVRSVPVAALKSERQKRQAAELEINELKKQLGIEEPDSEVSEELFKDRAETSRQLMVERKPDYEAMEEIFLGMASNDPTLKTKLRNNRNPAKFAYETAKASVEYQRYQDDINSDDWRAYQDFKKSKGVVGNDSVAEKRRRAALSLPEINRATAVASNNTQESTKTLDDMFA
jgi:hypothetical protein